MQPIRNSDRSSYRRAVAETRIEELEGLSPTVVRRIRGLGVETVQDLLTTWSKRDLLSRGYWIGKKAIAEIDDALTSLGVQTLGESVPRDEVRVIS